MEPVGVELAVNARSVGNVELKPGWNDYEFSVPAHLLITGLNTFLLTYSITPRLADPEFHGRNTVVADEYLRFTPASDDS